MVPGLSGTRPLRKSPLQGSERGDEGRERGDESISGPVFGTASLSAFVVLMTLGNARSSGPSRGKGGAVVVIESLLRNTEGALKPESVSTKQQRIAVLAQSHPTRELLARRVTDGVVRSSSLHSEVGESVQRRTECVNCARSGL